LFLFALLSRDARSGRIVAARKFQLRDERSKASRSALDCVS
jgi:hypothetical protein